VSARLEHRQDGWHVCCSACRWESKPFDLKSQATGAAKQHRTTGRHRVAIRRRAAELARQTLRDGP
jgi:hypothetical protein